MVAWPVEGTDSNWMILLNFPSVHFLYLNYGYYEPLKYLVLQVVVVNAGKL